MKTKRKYATKPHTRRTIKPPIGNILSIYDTVEFNGHEVDIYGEPENAWFLAVKIAKIIGYSTGNVFSMMQLVEEDDKKQMSVPNFSRFARGNSTPKWFVSEEGLYDILMRSSKPIAKEFRRYIKEILKDLRRRQFSNNIFDLVQQGMDLDHYDYAYVPGIFMRLDGHDDMHYYRFVDGKITEIKDPVEWEATDQLVDEARKRFMIDEEDD